MGGNVADARAAVEQILREVGVDYVDSVMLHGIRSAEDFQRREGTLEALCKAKDQGLIRMVGASTHVFTGSAMRACIDDPRIEAILTLANKTGVGLKGGSYEEHMALVREAHRAGKLVIAMKVLGEGYMADEAEEHVRWAFAQPDVDAVNLGTMSRPQIEMAARIASEESVSPAASAGRLEASAPSWSHSTAPAIRGHPGPDHRGLRDAVAPGRSATTAAKPQSRRYPVPARAVRPPPIGDLRGCNRS